jgi:hypothetical protein
MKKSSIRIALSWPESPEYEVGVLTARSQHLVVYRRSGGKAPHVRFQVLMVMNMIWLFLGCCAL